MSAPGPRWSPAPSPRPPSRAGAPTASAASTCSPSGPASPSAAPSALAGSSRPPGGSRVFRPSWGRPTAAGSSAAARPSLGASVRRTRPAVFGPMGGTQESPQRARARASIAMGGTQESPQTPYYVVSRIEESCGQEIAPPPAAPATRPPPTARWTSRGPRRLTLTPTSARGWGAASLSVMTALTGSAGPGTLRAPMGEPAELPEGPRGPTPTRRFRFTCLHCGRNNATRARVGLWHTCRYCGETNPGVGILRAVSTAPETPPVKRRRPKASAPSAPPAASPSATSTSTSSPAAPAAPKPRRRAVVGGPAPKSSVTTAAAPATSQPAAPPHPEPAGGAPQPPRQRRSSFLDRLLGHDEP
jgi:hypothetical protein